MINAVWPVLVFAGGMIADHLSWYLIFPVCVFFFGSLLHLYAGITRALSVQGVKKISLADAAKACAKVETGFYDFVEARPQDVIEFASMGRVPEGEDFLAFHEMRRVKEEAFMRKMKSRIGGDVGAAVAILQSLGITIDSDLRSLHWADSMARFFGAQARLLQDGHLEAAQKLDRNQLFF